MNALGYLITLSTVQNIQPTGGPVKDVVVKVADVNTLSNQLKSTPGLDLQLFKETGYHRFHNIGIYLSENLRDYMYYGFGKPEDEGLMITLFYDKPNGRSIMNGDDNLSYFIHRGAVDDDVKEQVQEFLDRRYAPYARNGRDVNKMV